MSSFVVPTVDTEEEKTRTVAEPPKLKEETISPERDKRVQQILEEAMPTSLPRYNPPVYQEDGSVKPDTVQSNDLQLVEDSEFTLDKLEEQRKFELDAKKWDIANAGRQNQVKQFTNEVDTIIEGTKQSNFLPEKTDSLVALSLAMKQDAARFSVDSESFINQAREDIQFKTEFLNDVEPKSRKAAELLTNQFIWGGNPAIPKGIRDKVNNAFSQSMSEESFRRHTEPTSDFSLSREALRLVGNAADLLYEMNADFGGFKRRVAIEEGLEVQPRAGDVIAGGHKERAAQKNIARLKVDQHLYGRELTPGEEEEVERDLGTLNDYSEKYEELTPGSKLLFGVGRTASYIEGPLLASAVAGGFTTVVASLTGGPVAGITAGTAASTAFTTASVLQALELETGLFLAEMEDVLDMSDPIQRDAAVVSSVMVGAINAGAEFFSAKILKNIGNSVFGQSVTRETLAPRIANWIATKIGKDPAFAEALAAGAASFTKSAGGELAVENFQELSNVFFGTILQKEFTDNIPDDTSLFEATGKEFVERVPQIVEQTLYDTGPFAFGGGVSTLGKVARDNSLNNANRANDTEIIKSFNSLTADVKTPQEKKIIANNITSKTEDENTSSLRKYRYINPQTVFGISKADPEIFQKLGVTLGQVEEDAKNGERTKYEFQQMVAFTDEETALEIADQSALTPNEEVIIPGPSTTPEETADLLSATAERINRTVEQKALMEVDLIDFSVTLEKILAGSKDILKRSGIKPEGEATIKDVRDAVTAIVDLVGEQIFNFSLITDTPYAETPFKKLFDTDGGLEVATGLEQDFAAALKDSKNLQQSLESKEGLTKGVLSITERGAYKITLLEEADLTTVLHEWSHIYMQELEKYIKDNEAPPQIINDYKHVKTFLGADPESDAPLTRDQNEDLAEAFELYLKEGAAPSIELEPSFERLSQWFASAYEHGIRRGVKINPEIKSVFDRQLATEEAIDLKRRADLYHYADMTPDQLAALSVNEEGREELAQIAAKGRNERRTEARLKLRRLEEENKEEWRRQANKAAEEHKLIRLRSDLNKDLGIDLSTIEDQETVEALKASKLPRKFWSGQNLSPAGKVAIDFGYESTQQMTDDLLTGIDKKQMKEMMYQAQKRAAFSEAIGADLAIQDPDELQKFTEYERFVAEAQGESSTSQALRLQARNEVLVQTTQQNREDFTYHRENIKSHATLRDAAIKKGDYKAALEHMRRLIFHMESFKTIQESMALLNFINDQMQSIPFDNAVDKNYSQALRQLGKQYGFLPVDLPDITEPVDMNTVFSFDVENSGELFGGYDAPIWIMNLRSPKDTAGQRKMAADLRKVREAYPAVGNDMLTPKDISNLADAIVFVHSRGIKIKGLELRKKAAGIVATTQNLKDVKKPKESRNLATASIRGVSSLTKTLVAGARRLQFIARELDNFSNIRPGKKGSFMGPTERHVYSTLADGFQTLADIEQQYAPIVGKAFRTLAKYMNREFIIEGLAPRETSVRSVDGEIVYEYKKTEKEEWRGDHLISILLNSGTEYSSQAMLEGNGISEANIQTIASTMSLEELTALNEVWQALGILWEPTSETYQRLNYKALRREEARSRKVKDSSGNEFTLEGGYYPLSLADDAKMQPKKSALQRGREKVAETVSKVLKREEVQEAPEGRQMLANLHNATFHTAIRDSHTIERQGTGGRSVIFDLGVLAGHLDYSSRYIAFAEPLEQVDQILNYRDPESGRQPVIAIYEQKMGRNSVRDGVIGIRKIMNDIAGNNRTLTVGGREPIKALLRLRHLATRFGLGLKLRVAAKQILSTPGFIYDQSWSVYKQGWKAISRVYLKGLVSMGQEESVESGISKMYRLSPTMQRRSGSYHDAVYTRRGKVGQVETKIDQAAFGLIRAVDTFTVAPMWLGVYETQMAKPGVTEQEAIRLADESIASSQPFNRIIDRSAWQRGLNTNTSFMLLFTMFTGYTNVASNRFINNYKAMRAGKLSVAAMTYFVTLQFVIPRLIINTLIDPFGKPEKDEKERRSIGEKVVSGALEVTADTVSGIPIVGQVASYFTRKVEPVAQWGLSKTGLIEHTGYKERVYRGEDPTFGVNVPIIDMIATVAAPAESLFNLIEDHIKEDGWPKDDKNWNKFLYNASRASGAVTGVPVDQVYKQLKEAERGLNDVWEKITGNKMFEGELSDTQMFELLDYMLLKEKDR